MPFPDVDLPRPDDRGLLQFGGVAADCPHLFNPTLLATASALVCFVRGVTADGLQRVFRCRLTADMRPVGMPVDWTSELAAFPGCPDRVADPRGFRWQGRSFVSFNTGHATKPNAIHVVEVDDDGKPIAPPMPCRLAAGRRVIEKNWGFFADDDRLFAIYSLDPLEILACEVVDGSLRCVPAWRHDWLAGHLREAFGPLHGGTSPCRADGRLLTVFQSRTRTADGFAYSGNLLELAPEPPFAPVAAGPWPLLQLADDERAMQAARPLNPRVASCLYPAGLVAQPGPASDRLTVTYGINDVAAGYRTYTTAALLAPLVPLTRCRPTAALRTFHWRPRPAREATPQELASGRFIFGNVGDSLQQHVSAQALGLRTFHAEHGGRRLLGAGSIAHRAGPGDVIWGSGFKDVPLAVSAEDKASILVRAVRGPLTAEYLGRQGVDVPADVAFFDPGLLVGELFRDEIAALRRAARPQGLLLVPHYRHTADWLDRLTGRDVRLRTVDCDLFVMLREILAAEVVVSSSLHGLILAEAVGVPAVLLRPPPTEPFTKYEDYYQGTGRATFPVIDDPADAMRSRIALPASPPADWRRTLPSPTDLAALGLTLPIVSLDERVAIDVPAAGPNVEALLAIGRFAGAHFTLEARLEGQGGTRLLFTTEAGFLHSLDLAAGTPATVDLNGRWLEEVGGVVHLSIDPAPAGAAVVTLVATSIADAPAHGDAAAPTLLP